VLDEATAEWAREQLRGPWWFSAAACADVDSDLFFLERGKKAAKTKAACENCPVVSACLQYAVDAGFDYGIFGGMTPTERRSWVRRRRLVRTA
jgi:WhiB family redox-sensing transcriptional regulator